MIVCSRPVAVHIEPQSHEQQYWLSHVPFPEDGSCAAFDGLRRNVALRWGCSMYVPKFAKRPELGHRTTNQAEKGKAGSNELC